jgi:hypothetical protein
MPGSTIDSDQIRGGAQIGDVPKLIDVGFGVPGLPSVSGGLLTDITAEVPVGNEVWVDKTEGSDAFGLRGRFDRPFLTIQAAINAAVAGDVVTVRPGTYNEVITCKDGVSLHGVDARQCVISRSNSVNETVVTMAESMHFANFRMVLSPTAGLTTGIVMPATTNATSMIVGVRQVASPSGSGTVRGLNISGTGVAAQEHRAAENSVFMGAGAASFGIEVTGVGGLSVLKSCLVAGGTGTGIKLTNGAVLSLLNRFTGTALGISVASGCTLTIDAATAYTEIQNLGTILRDSNIYVRNNFEAIVDPTVNDDRRKGYGAGSQWLNTVTNTLFTCASASVGTAFWSFIQTNNTPVGTLAPGEHFLGTLLDYGASGGVTVGEVQYTQIYLSAATVITKMRVYIDAGGNTGRNVRLGIYSQTDPTNKNGLPVTRVAQTGSTTTNGANGTFLSPLLLVSYSVPTSGYYWVAFVTDNSASLKFSVTPTVYRAGFLPLRRETGSGVNLPATAGVLTNPSSSVVYASAVE